jgi:hypothetical protein
MELGCGGIILNCSGRKRKRDNLGDQITVKIKGKMSSFYIKLKKELVSRVSLTKGETQRGEPYSSACIIIASVEAACASLSEKKSAKTCIYHLANP